MDGRGGRDHGAGRGEAADREHQPGGPELLEPGLHRVLRRAQCGVAGPVAQLAIPVMFMPAWILYNIGC